VSHAPQPAEILALGLVTPVGLDAPSAAAALRAGVSRVRESDVLDRDFVPHRMALVAEDALQPLAPALERASRTSAHARMLRLAAPALRQVIGAAGPGPVPLFLGLPEARPGEPDAVGETFLSDLVAQADAAASVVLPASQVHRQGGAAGLFALHAAFGALAGGPSDVAIVGAVDTFLDLRRLGMLENEGRVLGPRVMDGFIPGEGAAMLLLGTPGGAARLGLAPLARVLAAATGEEPGHRYSSEPYRGEGLAKTFQDVFAAAPSAPPVRCVYAGFNGESLPSKEWGVAHLRSSSRFAMDCRVEHPADCLGDSGAALGPIMLALAATGLARGYRRSPCLVWSTSDRGPRAAALLGTTV
jgi:3-oxoacyl-[acyl-carrier-protein] synthase-1